jgi:uncharacterized protein (TIGR04552 family)
MTEPHVTGEKLKPLEEFFLADLEAVRLILQGESVIDWHRLNFKTPEQIGAFIAAQEMTEGAALDEAWMAHVQAEAVSYLRRHLEYPIPKPVERASVRELLAMASGTGHRQTCACTILKCMHIIHHLGGRELLFMLPRADQEVFHLVEEKVYRIIGSMLASGFPITEFVGGRKNRDSLYTKLLCKQETVAAQIYDKLRFRIVTRTQADVLPVIQYLSQRLFPFNYIVPGQSINSVFDFERYCAADPHLAALLGEAQGGSLDDVPPVSNAFSAPDYRVIHFVVDMPVRLPQPILDRASPSTARLGSVIFVICEFQVIDRDTEAANERGNASHDRYKERQREAVMRRLQLGIRAPRGPTSRRKG